MCQLLDSFAAPSLLQKRPPPLSRLHADPLVCPPAPLVTLCVDRQSEGAPAHFYLCAPQTLGVSVNTTVSSVWTALVVEVMMMVVWIRANARLPAPQCRANGANITA